jgi:ABC-type sugar transport system permease subunit
MEESTRYSAEIPLALAPPLKERLRRFYVLSISHLTALIHTLDGATRMRHIAMITILLLRGAISARSILSAVIQRSIWRIILYSLLALLGVWFTATCLAIIGNAEGDRKLRRLVVVSYIYSHRHAGSFLLIY